MYSFHSKLLYEDELQNVYTDSHTVSNLGVGVGGAMGALAKQSITLSYSTISSALTAVIFGLGH